MTAAGNGRTAPLGRRLHVLVRGIEQLPEPGQGAPRLGPLPLGEVLHPAAVTALGLLLLNDWWAKVALARWQAAAWVTGKLSDVAGLVLAPVALTAAVGLGLALLAALGVPVDPSLRRRRLLAAIAVVAGGFVACKTSPGAARLVVDALQALGGRPRIVTDPTDLLALPALLVAWRAGRAELALVPRGHLHALLRQGRLRGVDPRLAEVRGAGAAEGAVARLEEALAQGSTALVNQALRALAA